MTENKELKTFTKAFLKSFQEQEQSLVKEILGANLNPITDPTIIPSRWYKQTDQPLHHLFLAKTTQPEHRKLIVATYHNVNQLMLSSLNVSSMMITPFKLLETLRDLKNWGYVNLDTSLKGWYLLTPNKDHQYAAFDWEDLTHTEVDEMLVTNDLAYRSLLRTIQLMIKHSRAKTNRYYLKQNHLCGPGRSVPLLWCRFMMLSLLHRNASRSEGAIEYKMVELTDEHRKKVRKGLNATLLQYTLEQMTQPEAIKRSAQTLRFELNHSLLKFDKRISEDDPWYKLVRIYNDYHWLPTKTVASKNK